MAEDHRRVEPRAIIVGTGMVNDPERLERIEEDRARRERAWRERPEVSFGAVLQQAPAKGALEDEVPPPTTSTPATMEPTPPPSSTSTSPEAKKAPSSKPKPSLPDPREKLLRQKLSQLEKAAPKTPLLSTETPPTGNAGAPSLRRPK